MTENGLSIVREDIKRLETKVDGYFATTAQNSERIVALETSRVAAEKERDQLRADSDKMEDRHNRLSKFVYTSLAGGGAGLLTAGGLVIERLIGG